MAGAGRAVRAVRGSGGGGRGALRLDRGDRHGGDDVLHQRAAREVVDRLAQTLEHRADRDGARRALHGLVRVVARVEVGKISTLARPATSEPGSFVAATEGSTAASYWIGPSISRSGRCARTISVALRTLSTSAPEPEVPVEYESIAIRGSTPKAAAVAADWMAMSAS